MISTYCYSQNVGIGTTTPVHKLHVINETPSINAVQGVNNGSVNGTLWSIGTNFSGIHGESGAGSAQYHAGVYGYQLGLGINSGGVVGAYNSSTWGGLGYSDAFGVRWGIYTPANLYTGGNAAIGTPVAYAKLHVQHSSTITSPQLLLYENNTAGYARINFQNASGNSYWAIAALTSATNANERLNFFNSIGGDILSITGNGKVGIGTTTPEFKLSLDTDGGILAKGTYNAGATLTTAGAGVRMFWYPKKAAFRAGRVSGTQWDDANIGLSSTAVGFNTFANGFAATAIGEIDTASGEASFAAGAAATAKGFASIALGFQSTASNDNSTAIGGGIASGLGSTAIGGGKASGANSTAIGEQVTASGNTSTAMGYQSIASADGSTAIGRSSQAIGNYSTAMGMLTQAVGNYSTSMGYSTAANGKYSTTLGDSTTATGYSSIAMGNATTALGYISTAMGYKTQANNSFSTAIGNGTTASGLNSTATGYKTTASGDFSIATGFFTTASGIYSTAMGQNSTAIGVASTAMGYNTYASGNHSIATGNSTSASGDYSTSMGFETTANGDFSTALGSSVSTNGKVGSFIYGDIAGGTTASCTANNQFMVRASGGTIFYSNTSNSTGVSLAAGGGSWTSLSDRNQKENFTDISTEDILLKVGAMPISNWNYKSQAKNIRHIGTMAQDFYAAFHLDGQSDTTINTLDIDGVNMASIQALKIRTDELKNAMEELKRGKANNDAIRKELTERNKNLQMQVDELRTQMQALKKLISK